MRILRHAAGSYRYLSVYLPIEQYSYSSLEISGKESEVISQRATHKSRCWKRDPTTLQIRQVSKAVGRTSSEAAALVLVRCFFFLYEN